MAHRAGVLARFWFAWRFVSFIHSSCKCNELAVAVPQTTRTLLISPNGFCRAHVKQTARPLHLFRGRTTIELQQCLLQMARKGICTCVIVDDAKYVPMIRNLARRPLVPCMCMSHRRLSAASCISACTNRVEHPVSHSNGGNPIITNAADRRKVKKTKVGQRSPHPRINYTISRLQSPICRCVLTPREPIQCPTIL